MPNETPIRDYDQLNRAIRFICRNSAAVVGERFFDAMVTDLAEVLGCDIVFVGEITEEQDAIETIAVFMDGATGPSMRYELCDTPCANVVGQKACVYADNVAIMFDRDQLLTDLKVRGYVGVPTYDAHGKASGIVVALYRHAIVDTDLASTAISVFSGRIGAELDRRRVARKTAQLEARALHAQKLESLGVMAGGLAHDFNNCLASILGSADLAVLSLVDGHVVHEHLRTIQESASTASALCRQLLAYAGKGRFKIESANLSELVREQGRLLGASVSKNVTLHLALSAEPGVVAMVDRGQIGQVLLNLVINGSEAIDGDGGAGTGLVRVTTGVMECDADYLNSTYLDASATPGSYAYIEVSDDGPGMDPHTLRHLFDPFFTTKFSGRGLGLAAILGIVKGHQGTIKVYSEVGSGSTIKVLIPVTDQPPERRRRRPVELPASDLGTVLLVDDNEQIRIVVERMLAALGYKVLVAEDGEHAMRELRAHEGELNFVLLDLTMPRMDGEEAFRAMRLYNEGIRVILMSGFNEQDTIQHFVGKGLAGFLQKPFSLRALRAQIASLPDLAG